MSFKISIWFYWHNIIYIEEYWHNMLISGMQHRDSTFVYIMEHHDKWSYHLSPYRVIIIFWLFIYWENYVSNGFPAPSLHSTLQYLRYFNVISLAVIKTVSWGGQGFCFNFEEVEVPRWGTWWRQEVKVLPFPLVWDDATQTALHPTSPCLPQWPCLVLRP